LILQLLILAHQFVYSLWLVLIILRFWRLLRIVLLADLATSAILVTTYSLRLLWALLYLLWRRSTYLLLWLRFDFHSNFLLASFRSSRGSRFADVFNSLLNISFNLFWVIFLFFLFIFWCIVIHLRSFRPYTGLASRYISIWTNWLFLVSIWSRGSSIRCIRSIYLWIILALTNNTSFRVWWVLWILLVNLASLARFTERLLRNLLVWNLSLTLVLV